MFSCIVLMVNMCMHVPLGAIQEDGYEILNPEFFLGVKFSYCFDL